MIISAGVLALIVGLGYILASNYLGISSNEPAPKFDHFRFQPIFNFLDSENSKDLGNEPRGFLTIDFYRDVNGKYEKAMKEVYKDKEGKPVEVVTVTNSTDTFVFMAIKSSDFAKINPISLTQWNEVAYYDSFDINNDGKTEDVFKLNISKARDYYEIKDKEREFAQVVIMIPVKFKNINIDM